MSAFLFVPRQTGILVIGLTQQKYFFDESNGLWYELRGDYSISCLTVPVQDERPIGIWGQRHLRFIKTEPKALYTELLTSG